MTASFAGSMIANPLLGKPILGAISNEYNVILATLIWWGVFFSPGDIIYSLAKNQVLYVPICVIKEIYRGKKTLGGISDAAKVFPDQALLMVLIGLIKGNGSGFMKPLTKLICGKWEPGRSELLSMSVTSKECLVAAILLVMDRQGYVPFPLSGALLYLVLVTTFLTLKLSSPLDPFTGLETTLCNLTLISQPQEQEGGEKEEKTE